MFYIALDILQQLFTEIRNIHVGSNLRAPVIHTIDAEISSKTSSPTAPANIQK